MRYLRQNLTSLCQAAYVEAAFSYIHPSILYFYLFSFNKQRKIQILAWTQKFSHFTSLIKLVSVMISVAIAGTVQSEESAVYPMVVL